MVDAKKCVDCGMPLGDKKNVCSCDEKRCVHCCKCDKNCECGCKEKQPKTLDRNDIIIRLDQKYLTKLQMDKRKYLWKGKIIHQ